LHIAANTASTKKQLTFNYFAVALNVSSSNDIGNDMASCFCTLCSYSYCMLWYVMSIFGGLFFNSSVSCWISLTLDVKQTFSNKL